MDRADIAWLAGLLEGEGSIFERPQNSRPSWTISIEMTDKDVVERAAKVWGHGNVRKVPKRQRPQSLGTKDIYVWRFEDRGQVYALLAAIYPWLGNRRRKKAKKALKALPPVTPFKRGPKVLVSEKQLQKALELKNAGYTYREISGILGCSFGTVQRRLSKVLRAA